jgi:hypothetical protein
MTSPEGALQQARDAAAAMRAAGSYAEQPDVVEAAPAQITRAKLLRWAMIEPDLSYVRSTRRLGAPITGVKRLLLRLLLQYHTELVAQQTRFNVGVFTELERIGARLDELERKLDERGPP